jgi:succinate dehydrogenase / fumarate reductase iron-sulfur subunit
MANPSKRSIRVKVYRFEPTIDEKPFYKTCNVPLVKGMSVLDVLDYIYQRLDPTLSYYDHAACRHGLCGKCTMTINGKTALACQALVDGDLVLEPPSRFKVVKDLVHTTNKE